MIKSIVLPSLMNALFTLLIVGILFFNSVNSAWAKIPPEIRNQQDLNLEPDMHGQDLSGNEYVKFDLNGFNFSESNFEGAKIDGADFTDAVLSRTQQKQLCAIANGTNSSTGESTEYSLGC